MMKVLWHIVLFCAASSAGGRSEMASLREEIWRTVEKVEQLEAEREDLMKRAEVLAGRIEKLKGEGGIIGRYRLKRALKRSQELARRIEALDRKIEALKSELSRKKEKLKDLYEAEISFVLEELERNPGQADSLLKRLRELRMAMEDIEASEVGTPEAKFRAILIEIDKDDTPEIIREKADLITDVVDRLKRRLRDLERRVEELEREMETEERIRDLLDEISLFDEDVFAGHRLQVQTRAEETKGIRGPSEARRASPDRVPEISVSGWEISPEETKIQISRLREEMERLKGKIAELSKKAEEFRRRAAELEGAER